jgi:hypothetical protein
LTLASLAAKKLLIDTPRLLHVLYPEGDVVDDPTSKDPTKGDGRQLLSRLGDRRPDVVK